MGFFWGALGDTDRDRDWVDLGHRLGWGFCWGRSVGPPLSSLWGHGVLLFLSLAFSFLFVLGGSGVLSHGAVFGLFFLSISFLFSFLCGHWDIYEH